MLALHVDAPSRSFPRVRWQLRQTAQQGLLGQSLQRATIVRMNGEGLVDTRLTDLRGFCRY